MGHAIHRNYPYAQHKACTEAQNTQSSVVTKANQNKDNKLVALVAIVDKSDLKPNNTHTLNNNQDYNDDDCFFSDSTATDNEDVVLYSDWLADSATTSYITNRCNAFLLYQTIPDVSIGGVGSIKSHTIGQGDSNLVSKCNGQEYLLKLYNVLHIPNNKNNLFSLG